MFSRWYIAIDEKMIKYCTLLGKEQQLGYDEIKRAEIKKNNMIFMYTKNGKIQKLSVEQWQDYIVWELIDHNVHVVFFRCI